MKIKRNNEITERKILFFSHIETERKKENQYTFNLKKDDLGIV